nr:hypothetical protein CFP56_36202 [Quercus suber]
MENQAGCLRVSSTTSEAMSSPQRLVSSDLSGSTWIVLESNNFSGAPSAEVLITNSVPESSGGPCAHEFPQAGDDSVAYGVECYANFALSRVCSTPNQNPAMLRAARQCPGSSPPQHPKPYTCPAVSAWTTTDARASRSPYSTVKLVTCSAPTPDAGNPAPRAISADSVGIGSPRRAPRCGAKGRAACKMLARRENLLGEYG